MGGLDDAQSRAESGAGRQRAGVAVVQHLRAGFDQAGAVSRELPVPAVVVRRQGLRRREHRPRPRVGIIGVGLRRRAYHAGGPGQIDGRGAGAGNVFHHAVEMTRERAVRLGGVGMRAQSDAIGPRHAERGRAADGQGADGLHDLRHLRAMQYLNCIRQTPLIQDAHGAVAPFDNRWDSHLAGQSGERPRV